MINQKPQKYFAVLFREFNYWDVQSLRIALTNRCMWPTVRLSSVCKIRVDVVSQQEIENRTVRLLDRISFDEGKVFAGKRTSTKMVQYRAKLGDIVVSKINARKRAIGIVPDEHDIGITIHFRSLIPDSTAVDRVFLWVALRSPFCTNQFSMKTGGIGKGEISEEQLLTVEIPLPPLPIQQAIAEKWEKSQKEIRTIKGNIEQLKADLNDNLLKDLGLKSSTQATSHKSFAVWWEDFLRWGVNYNQAIQNSVDISKGKYPVVEVGSTSEMIQYGTSEKANSNRDGTPIIRMNNIIEGMLDISELKHIPLSEYELKKLLLRDGDILFNRTNSKKLVGKCAVFHENGEYVFASYLIRVRINTTKVIHDFLVFVINSPIGRQQIDALSRQIIGQANINSEELRSLQLPLPPIKIQHQIMQRVENSRVKINREREAAERKAREIEGEIEALILGARKIKV